jgi:hypothetical protein
VTLEQAQQEMTLRLKREVKNYPEEHKRHDSVRQISRYNSSAIGLPASTSSKYLSPSST